MYIYLSGMIYIMLNIINSSCRVYIRKISILIQGRTTDCTCTWDAYYYDTVNRFWVLWLSILYGYWKLSYWILLQNPASGLIVLSGCGTSGRIAFLTAVSSSFLDIEIKKALLFTLYCWMWMSCFGLYTQYFWIKIFQRTFNAKLSELSRSPCFKYLIAGRDK